MTNGVDRGNDGAAVELICVMPPHLEIGLRVPDGDGTLTVAGRRWAYCTAGLQNVDHQWKETGGVAFDAIRHAEVRRYLRDP